jgi:hypothetical protein
MGKLIRMDQTGHTTLAEWSTQNPTEIEAAVAAFRTELSCGSIAMITTGPGQAEMVRDLPVDAELVIMRRPIAGG